jgi:hypothetical protein
MTSLVFALTDAASILAVVALVAFAVALVWFVATRNGKGPW